MPELLTMQDLANGHLDVKALGEAANGDENTIVTTRTGKTYPSAKRAINIMFQNGGLPATPFETKAEMQTDGASLADGQLAMVHNETANNGLYVKTAGAWVKSDYDPVRKSKDYTNHRFDDIQNNLDIIKTENVYKPEYIRGHITHIGVSDPDKYAYNVSDGTVAIIPVSPDKTYTVKVFGDATDGFRVASFASPPSRNWDLGERLHQDGSGTTITNTARTKELTVTIPKDSNYLAICWSVYREVRPKVMIVEGVNPPQVYKYPSEIQNIRRITKGDILQPLTSGANIFDGVFYPYALYSLGSGDLNYYLLTNWSNHKGSTIILKVKPNTTYTFSTPDVAMVTRFGFAYYNSEPKLSSMSSRSGTADKSVNVPTSESTSYTFTTEDRTEYVAIFLGLSNQRPRVMVNEGSVAMPYESPQTIDRSYLDVDNLRSRVSRNLFNGIYTKGELTVGSTGTSVTLSSESKNDLGRLAIVELDTNKSYTISVAETANTREPAVLALFSGKPDVLDNKDGELVHNTDTRFEEFTFTTSGIINPYLVAYVSSVGFQPRLQIEEGGKASSYVDRYVIPKEFIESEESAVFKPLPKYGMFVNFNTLYKTEGVIPDFITYNKSADVIAEYDAAIAHLDGYVTKKSLGVDNFGYPIYAYRTSPRVQWLSETQMPSITRPGNMFIKNPKIILSAGMHGSERKAVHGLMYAFKQIMHNPTNDPAIEFIKRHVDIAFIPIINNSGFEDYSYHNRDDINPNRDFPPAGKVESMEAQVLMQYFDENSDADFYIDFHTGSNSENRFGYWLTDVPEFYDPFSRMFQQLGGEWQKNDLPEMPQNLDYSFSWGVRTIHTTGFAYMQDVHGVRSGCIEAPATNIYMNAEQEIRFYSELVINTLYACLNLAQQ